MSSISDFDCVWKAVGFLFIVDFGVFFTISLAPEAIDLLYLSLNRPWGVVTSMFAHADADHLANNLLAFAVAALLFIAVNLNLDKRSKKRAGRLFLHLPILAGAIVNVGEYVAIALKNASSTASWGSSGIVYGATGLLLIAAIRNLPMNLKIAGAHKAEKPALWKRRIALFSFLLPIGMVGWLVLEPSGFFSAGAGVDIRAHALGFLFGYLGGMIMLFSRDR
ncbi:MAG: rhomboid family intramembrane serine protease [Candidatus Hadarchaeales archaeon]